MKQGEPLQLKQLRKRQLLALFLLSLLLIGSVGWLIGKCGVAHFSSSEITLQLSEPSLQLSWGGDPFERVMYSFGCTPWPPLEDEPYMGYTGRTPPLGFSATFNGLEAVFRAEAWRLNRLGLALPQMRIKARSGSLVIPLGWFPLALMAYLVFSVIGSRRSRRIGCCRRCGYDLRSLTSSRCPECGTTINLSSLPSAGVSDRAGGVKVRTIAY